MVRPKLRQSPNQLEEIKNVIPFLAKKKERM